MDASIKVNTSVSVSVVMLIWISFLISCDPECCNTPTNYIVNGPQDLYPAFSPSGGFIAYYHDEWDTPDPPGYPSGLYIINNDGSNRRLVLLGDHYSPSWSPDGNWLVFSSGGVIQKCKINGDSITRFSELDTLEYPEFYFPDWTTGGKYILFDKPLNPEWGFYYMTSNFQNAKRIFGLEILGRNPELSPNEKYLIYEAGKGGGNNVEVSEIFLNDTLGANKIQLTQNNRDNRGPTWSHDGQKIVWSSSLRICIMNADGTNQHQIAYGNDPSWSANNKIVFSHANTNYTKELLYSIDPDGNNKRQITF